jgi:hypothetical protein
MCLLGAHRQLEGLLKLLQVRSNVIFGLRGVAFI